MTGAERLEGLDEAATLVEQQQWSDALRALGPLRRSAPSSAEVWRLQTLALRGAGELNEAQMAADRWSSLVPGSADAAIVKAELLSARGKAFAAAEVASEVTQLRPDDAAAHLRLAGYYRDAGLLPRARTAVQRALELDRDRWEAYELAGLIEMGSGQPAVAATFFQKALRLDPDNGRLAEQLQRAIGSEQEKAAGAKKAAGRAKKDARQRARDVAAMDKAEAKRQRKVARQLGTGGGRRGFSFLNLLALLAVLAFLAYVGYLVRTSRREPEAAANAPATRSGAKPSEGSGNNRSQQQPSNPAARWAAAPLHGDAPSGVRLQLAVDPSTIVLGACFSRTASANTETLTAAPCTDAHNAEVVRSMPLGGDVEPGESTSAYVHRLCPEAELTTYVPSLETTFSNATVIVSLPNGPGAPAWCFLQPWGEEGSGSGTIRGQ